MVVMSGQSTADPFPLSGAGFMKQMQLLSVPIMAADNIVSHDERAVTTQRADVVRNEGLRQGQETASVNGDHRHVVCPHWEDRVRTLGTCPRGIPSIRCCLCGCYIQSPPLFRVRHNTYAAEPNPLCICDNCRRSEEHTSELQSLMRISFAVFCLKKKTDISST